MSIVKQFLFSLFFMVNVILAQSFFTLQNHSFYGTTSVVRFDSTFSKAYSLAGNTFVSYNLSDSIFSEIFHFDFTNHSIFTMIAYSAADSQYIYVVSEDKLFTYQIGEQEIVLLNTNTLPDKMVIDCGGKDVMLTDDGKLFIALREHIGVYDITSAGEPVPVDTVAVNGRMGALAADSLYLYAGVMESTEHSIYLFDKDSLILTTKIDVSQADMYDHPIDNIIPEGYRIFVTFSAHIFEIDAENPHQPVVREMDVEFTEYSSSEISVYDDSLYFYDSISHVLNIYDVAIPFQSRFVTSDYLLDPLWVVQSRPGNEGSMIISTGHGGIQVFSLDNDNKLQKIASSIPTSGYLKHIKYYNGNLFLTDAKLGLILTQVAPNGTPLYRSNFEAMGRDFLIHPEDSNIGYLTTGAYSVGGLYALNINNDFSIDSLSFYDTDGGALKLTIHSGVAYLCSTRESALLIFDLKNPSRPEYKGIFKTPSTPRALKIRDDNVGILAFSGISKSGLSSIDLNDPLHPVALDTLYLETHSVSDVDFYQDYAVALGFSGGLFMIDISDYSNLNLVSTSDIASGRSIEVNGNFAFISGWEIVAVYLKNIRNPKEAGRYKLFNTTTFYNNIGEDLEVRNDTVFVANGPTGVYVLHYDSTLLSINSDTEIKTEQYRLYPNYPNPFNPSTTLSFSLPENEFVSMKIYDISGREVQTLKKGYVQKGLHKYIFNAENLASGLYIVHLKAGTYSASCKIIYLK